MSNTNNKADTVSENTNVESREEKKKAIIKEVVTDVIWAVCLAVILATFIYFCGISQVSGTSMEPSFENGDVMITVKRFTLNYNDVVVANTDKALIVKRVIGMEGDEIDIRDGKVYRNGLLLNEDYIKGKTYAYDELITFPLMVGEGKVFLLGDNREKSADSRSSKYGLVNADDIIGKVAIHIPVFWKNVIIGVVALFVAYLILSIIKDESEKKETSEIAEKLVSDDKNITADGDENVINTESLKEDDFSDKT